MSRSHRAHLTPRRRAERSGIKYREGEARNLKTSKQLRPNVRARLKKEYQ